MNGPSTDESVGLCLCLATHGSEMLVTLSGELDIATAATVTTLVEEVTTACRRIVFDARGLRFLDACGLRALRGGPTGWGANVQLVVRAPSRPVTRVLELTGMGGLVEPVGEPVLDEESA